jgi:hypothetical protein
MKVVTMAASVSPATFAKIAPWWLALSAAGALASQVPDGKGVNCPKPPVEPCTIGHGRFSTQNGITQTIWLVGTTRRLDVANEADNFFPPTVLKYLEMTSKDHSYIFGDFTICPVEPDKPGYMRTVCVADAKNLVVQNAMDLWPPFRVQSTWDRREK